MCGANVRIFRWEKHIKCYLENVTVRGLFGRHRVIYDEDIIKMNSK
jgi:hypothetical protein